MAKYEKNLKPELVEAKLQYIYLRWGVDKESLDSMIESEPLFGLGKMAKKKFRGYLRSLEQAFSSLAERHSIKDHFKNNPFLEQYNRYIQSKLMNEAKFLNYLTGSWDDEILKVVSIAQKKYMIPKRAKPLSQQKPNVTFQPRSEYKDYYNG